MTLGKDPVERTKRQSTSYNQVSEQDMEAEDYRDAASPVDNGQGLSSGQEFDSDHALNSDQEVDCRQALDGGQVFDGGQVYADGVAAGPDRSNERASPQEAVEEVEYWEEVTAEDGAVYYYNHTDQEYHTSLPICVNADQEGRASSTIYDHADQEYHASSPIYDHTDQSIDQEYHTSLQIYDYTDRDDHASSPNYEYTDQGPDQEYHTSSPIYDGTDQEYQASSPIYDGTDQRTDKEYHASSPIYDCTDNQEYPTPSPIPDDANTATNNSLAHSSRDRELQLTAVPRDPPDTREEGVMERWKNQMWDGIDGEVFVPWTGEDSAGDLKASPDQIDLSGDLPQVQGEGEEPHFAPDDPAIVRQQNLRALLVLLPAKVMDGVVKVAMEKALLHTRRTKTAEAERRRRSLLSSRAEFRHTRSGQPSKEVLSPGGLACLVASSVKDGEQGKDDVRADSEAESFSSREVEEGVSWRNERDILVGGKLQEVLRVLFSGSKEEARLTMRAVCLSSQGIGPEGALALAPALKTCVISALYLGNNAIGDEGVACMADGLSHARGLQELHLNNNEITDVGCHKLTNALGPLKVLSVLNLSHNPFGEKACLSLATLLSQHGCSLRSLSVAGCLDVDPSAWKTSIFRERGEGMARGIPRPGDEGAVVLAAALLSPYGCPLRRFCMTNAGVRSLGVKAIAAALCANETLETVDLSGNDFACKEDDAAGQSAVDLLSFGLQVNTSVRTIVLRACGLSRDQVLAIQDKASCSSVIADRKRRQEGTESPSDVRARDGSSKDNAGNGKRLSWRTEKLLGFRAAHLRDWLLDAARVKGMRYPRPPVAAEGDEVSLIDINPRGHDNDKASIAGAQARKTCSDFCLGEAKVPGGDMNQRDAARPASLVGSRIWAGLVDLQSLVNYYNIGPPAVVTTHENNNIGVRTRKAAQLEDGAQEGRKLAEIVGTECKGVDIEQAALVRERQSLRRSRTQLQKDIQQEASAIRLSLIDAENTRDVSADGVRRLLPVAEAAIRSARARGAELEESKAVSRGREGAGGVERSTVAIAELLESDWSERSNHAEVMQKELGEAQERLEGDQRRIEELREAEQSLKLRSENNDTVFREKSEGISSSLANLRTKRAALSKTEMILNSLTTKLEELARSTREEEALRAVVPAGSGRRELDLEVAEAIRLTSNAARETEKARRKFSEAAERLENGRKELLTSRSRDGVIETGGRDASSTLASSTRPWTSPAPTSANPDRSREQAGPRQRLSLPPATKTASFPPLGVLETGPVSNRGENKSGTENSALGEPLPDLRAATASAAEDLKRLQAAYYCKAEQDFYHVKARGESAAVKRALALIRDHADVLRLNKNDAPEAKNDGLLCGTTWGQGKETPLRGAQLNPRVALGAKIAMLRGTGEEDEEGNPVFPVIDDKEGLTVGQRLKQLRDEREKAQREKQKAHMEHSRKLKRHLRARKRLYLTERRARRAAQSMESQELVEALQKRGKVPEIPGELDELRRVFALESQHEMRVRLHATSRWTKSREKHRARTDTVEIGEIAAKRQRALITSSRATTAPSLPSSRGSRHHLRNRFWVKATDFDD